MKGDKLGERTGGEERRGGEGRKPERRRVKEKGNDNTGREEKLQRGAFGKGEELQESKDERRMKNERSNVGQEEEEDKEKGPPSK